MVDECHKFHVLLYLMCSMGCDFSPQYVLEILRILEISKGLEKGLKQHLTALNNGPKMVPVANSTQCPPSIWWTISMGIGWIVPTSHWMNSAHRPSDEQCPLTMGWIVPTRQHPSWWPIAHFWAQFWVRFYGKWPQTLSKSFVNPRIMLGES